jgi:hypothetical protein
MCGEIFWKGVVVFCLTFGLSVFVSGFFGSKAVPVQVAVTPAAENKSPAENLKSENTPAPAEKNCKPIDKDLKYQTIPLKDESRLVEKAARVSPSRLSEKKSESKKPDEKVKEQTKTAEPQFYDPSEDPAEIKTLLHKEQCFEAQKPK